MSHYFGSFGGQYVAQPLIPALNALEKNFREAMQDTKFLETLRYYQHHYVGRATPISYLSNISAQLGGAQIYCKREDMTNVGAHKINHALLQALLALRMGKTELIAETGAGMHGTSTAMIGAQLGLKVKVFMGATDIARQQANVDRMKIMAAEVIAVHEGSATLKDAVNAAMKYRTNNLDQSAYILGSSLGPAPYPEIVRTAQSIVGQECLSQFPEIAHKNHPDHVIACVGGGCNSIGIFSAYLDNPSVNLTGVEAGGRSNKLGDHAKRFGIIESTVAIAHGYKSYFLQDSHGNIAATHSISAGLDYPGVGPEHADLYRRGRVHYTSANDNEVLEALLYTARSEGILAALESSHALAYAYKLAPTLPKDNTILVNLSGRGDKDMHTILELIKT